MSVLNMEEAACAEEDLEGKLPPHSDAMERGVLSCILNAPGRTFSECVARFKCGDEVFFDLRHKNIYRALQQLSERSAPIDPVTLFQHINDSGQLENCGGIQYISALPDAAPSVENFSYYADQVAELFMQRKTLAACAEAAVLVYQNKADANAVISAVENKLQSIRELRSNDLIVFGKQAAQLLAENLEERFNLQGKKSGVVTGLHRFDKITDGLQYGEQTIIGARPSQGKTALATTIIRNACLVNKVPTLVITLEMSIHALCRRMLANHCRIPMNQLRDGSFTQNDFEKFKKFNVLMSSSPIYFMDSISGTDSGRICHAIKQAVKSSGIKLVVIDYLQKIHATGRHEKRTYEIAQVSGALKATAVETNVAMFTLAQLNREPDGAKGRSPRLSDLADSGQIERDGDCIALLERNRKQDEGREANLIIAKQRDGEIGVVPLLFEGQFCVFENTEFDSI